jgi:hypothetical protein
VFVEHPNLALTAPYVPPPGSTLTPDAFLDPGLGPDDMFRLSGLQQPVRIGIRGGPGTPSIAIAPKNFGGAIANSIRGITLAEGGFPADTTLPDYNLDGDRSYAWPCWDITNPEPVNAPLTPSTGTPLRPEATLNDSSTREALAEVIPVLA